MNCEFQLCFCFLMMLQKESLCSLAVSVCPDALFMLILAQISGWMMINVVAILAYLIIHINILIFAVGSQIFIELSPILSPQHTHPLTLCVAKVLNSFSPFLPQFTIFFLRSFWLEFTAVLELRAEGTVKCVNSEHAPMADIGCGHYHGEENYSRWSQPPDCHPQAAVMGRD